MNTELVSVSDLHADPANVRKHDQRNVDTIKASLVRFGQQKPIVVSKDGVVVAGNGLLEAAKAIGWEKVSVVRTGLKGSEATAYAIADNRTAELAEWDDDGLAGMLNGLATEDADLLAAAGFTDEELQKLMTDGTSPDGFPEVDESIDTEHQCPKCGYAWSGGT